MTKLYIARHGRCDGPEYEQSGELMIGQAGINDALRLANNLALKLDGRNVFVESANHIAARDTAQIVADNTSINCINPDRRVKTDDVWSPNGRSFSGYEAAHQARYRAGNLFHDYGAALIIVSQLPVLMQVQSKLVSVDDDYELSHGEFHPVALPPESDS